MAGTPTSGEGTILNPAVYKWALILALGLLFLAGVVIAFEEATGGEQEATGVIDLGAKGGAPRGSGAGAAYEDGVALHRSSDPSERARGLAILAAADPVRGAAPVKNALRDPHPEVRRRALEILLSYRMATTPATIIPFLSDADQGVRTAAAGLLVSVPFEPALMYQIASPLGSGDPGAIAAALQVWRAFAPRDPGGAAQALSPLLASADPAQLSLALGAIEVVPETGLSAFKPALLDAASRHAGTPEGDQAAAAAERIP